MTYPHQATCNCKEMQWAMPFSLSPESIFSCTSCVVSCSGLFVLISLDSFFTQKHKESMTTPRKNFVR